MKTGVTKPVPKPLSDEYMISGKIKGFPVVERL
jgi:hypothetical protein